MTEEECTRNSDRLRRQTDVVARPQIAAALMLTTWEHDREVVHALFAVRAL